MNAIILGGTHDHIRLIEILKIKGYHVILIDYLDNPIAAEYADEHIIESTADIEKVLNISKEKNAALVIATCIDSALVVAAYVSEKLNLPFHISYKTALALTDKTEMKKIFVDNRIPTSKFILNSEINNASINELTYPLVVKPADANSSKGVLKVNNLEQTLDAIESAMEISKNKKVIIEEYKEGEEFSVDVIISAGKAHLLMITKNIKSKLNKNKFTIIQSKFPATDNPIILNTINKIAEKIANAYCIKNGPLLIQLIHYNGELNVIEFSSRIGGGSKHHFIKFMTGFDILHWFVGLILGEKENVIANEKYRFGCVYYLYASNGIIKSYNGFDSVFNNGVINEYFIYKSTGTIVSNHISSNDRGAGFLIADNDYQSFKNRINEAIETIKIIGHDEKVMTLKMN